MQRALWRFLTLAATAILATWAPAAEPVLVEAEAFESLGGWVVDTQAMDVMGSPYLLAHGLGEPVADATATVTFPAAGEYRVFVRTRDWTPPHAAGKFQLLFNGLPLAETFGSKGDGAWFWQDGGAVQVATVQARLALHDLTGFEGRCDAILFSPDPAFAPPAEGEALRAFRRQALKLPDQPADAGPYDVVVVGGGIAGCSAAVAAARLGLRVALIQDRPVLGGNNSSEIRVAVQGNRNVPPFPKTSNVVNELNPRAKMNAGPESMYGDDAKRKVVQSQPGIDLHLNTHVSALEKSGDRITAVIGRQVRTGAERRFRAPLFIDCTGDGAVGFLAGADYRLGAETNVETGEPLAPAEAKPSRSHMGVSNLWYAASTAAPCAFPELPWAIQTNSGRGVARGDWDWESGFTRDPIAEIEQIRDYNLRAIYGTWAYTKNRAPDKDKYANWKLAWVAYVGGIRESRRLIGDLILSYDDIRLKREFPDAVLTSSWSIDLHYPVSLKQDYRARVKDINTDPFPIPFRCLYSRNVPNLMMAGRDISVTHVVLGSVRVQNTTGTMGAVVGRAAFICRKYACSPRDVYEHHLDEFLQLLADPPQPPPAP